MSDKRQLPPEFFQAVSLILPRIILVFRETALTPVDLYVLWYLRHQGKTTHGLKAVLNEAMVDNVAQLFRYSRSQASKHINSLTDRGFVDSKRVTAKEKSELFGDPSGRKKVLVLLPKGSKKIDDFIKIINVLYSERTRYVSPILLKGFSTVLASIGKAVIRAEHVSISEQDQSAEEEEPLYA